MSTLGEEGDIRARIWIRAVTEDGLRGLEFELTDPGREACVQYVLPGTYVIKASARHRLVPIAQLPPTTDAAATWRGREDRVAWVMTHCTEGELAMLYRLLRQRRWTDWGAQQVELHERRVLEEHKEVKMTR